MEGEKHLGLQSVALLLKDHFSSRLNRPAPLRVENFFNSLVQIYKSYTLLLLDLPRMELFTPCFTCRLHVECSLLAMLYWNLDLFLVHDTF